MYCTHFGLNLPPFSNTPDPRFFFDAPDHEEALASLLYVAQERKGFALVTGEVGTGKTLLSRIVLSRLPAGTRTALITHAGMDGAELLQVICAEFRIETPSPATPQALIRLLETFLLEQYARDRLAVVVLDEAHRLSADAFEQLRMLGNLEAEDAKVLQLLILGQPELDERLAQDDLRQLRQRIFRTYRLNALSASECTEYIRYRLRVAGADDREIFTEDAIRAIHAKSGGVPRLINQLCDNGLLGAYSQGVAAVTGPIIEEVSKHIPACQAYVPAPSASRRPFARPSAVQAGAAPATRLTEYRQLADVDSLVGQITQQQQQAEQCLHEIVQQMESVGAGRQEAAQFLARARSLHDTAAQCLQHAQRSAEACRSQFAAVAEGVGEHARSQKDRAQILASAGGDRLDALHALSGNFRDAIDALEQGVESRVLTMINRQSEDVQQIRRELKALASQVERVSTESNSKDDEIERTLRGAVNAAQQRVDALRETVQSQAQSIENKVAELAGDACIQVDRSRAAAAEAVDAARSEMQEARDHLSTACQETETLAGSLEARIRSAGEETVGILDGLRRQAGSVVAEVRAETERAARDCETRSKSAAARLDEMGRPTMVLLEKRIEETKVVRIELEAALRESDGRLENLRDELNAADGEKQHLTAELASVTRTLRSEMDAMRAEATTSVERMRLELELVIAEGKGSLDEAREQSRADLRDVIGTIRRVTGQTDGPDDASAPMTSLAELRAAFTQIHAQAEAAATNANLAGARLRESVAANEQQLQGFESKLAALKRELTTGITQDVEQAKVQIAQAHRESSAQLRAVLKQLNMMFHGAAGAGSEGTETAVTIVKAQEAIRTLRMNLDAIAVQTEERTSELETRIAAATEQAKQVAVQSENESETLRQRAADIAREAGRRVEAATAALEQTFTTHRDRVMEFKRVVETDRAASGREASATIERAQTESRSAAQAVAQTIEQADRSLAEIRDRIGQMLSVTESRIGDSGQAADSLVERLEQSLEQARTEALRVRGALDAERVRVRGALQSCEAGGAAMIEQVDRTQRELQARTQRSAAALAEQTEQIQQRLDATWRDAAERL
ncbi:MAG: AAA family ATPase, partial [Phycisphaerae bacterium]